ncbi:DUF2802 domain-containing protein [Pseudomonadota bacterium]
MLDTINIFWISFAAVSLVCIAGFWALLSLYSRQRRELGQARRQIESVSANLAALCSGAVGVDKRVARLEKVGRDFRVWQEREQSQGQGQGQGQGGNSFGQAIQLVRSGATAGKLVEELGLSRNEADLIVMLHGMKEAS